MVEPRPRTPRSPQFESLAPAEDGQEAWRQVLLPVGIEPPVLDHDQRRSDSARSKRPRGSHTATTPQGCAGARSRALSEHPQEGPEQGAMRRNLANCWQMLAKRHHWQGRRRPRRPSRGVVRKGKTRIPRLSRRARPSAGSIAVGEDKDRPAFLIVPRSTTPRRGGSHGCGGCGGCGAPYPPSRRSSIRRLNVQPDERGWSCRRNRQTLVQARA